MATFVADDAVTNDVTVDKFLDALQASFIRPRGPMHFSEELWTVPVY